MASLPPERGDRVLITLIGVVEKVDRRKRDFPYSVRIVNDHGSSVLVDELAAEDVFPWVDEELGPAQT